MSYFKSLFSLFCFNQYLLGYRIELASVFRFHLPKLNLLDALLLYVKMVYKKKKNPSARVLFFNLCKNLLHSKMF